MKINERNSCFHSWSLVLIASLTFQVQDSVDKGSHDIFSTKKLISVKIHTPTHT